MSLAAIIPIAAMQSANASLESAGYGPRNFSLDGFGATGITHAALHTWRTDDAFAAAVKALPGVVYDDAVTDPISAVDALVRAQGAYWGEHVARLPDSGMTVAGAYYTHDDPNMLWLSIVAFSRDVYSGAPETLAASIIRRIARPGAVVEWWQPLDGFDACKLKNPFTGLPDVRTHKGKTWKVTQADGAGNNVYEPGVWGWTEVV